MKIERKKRGLNYDAKLEYKVKEVSEAPENCDWLPISIASLLTGYTSMMLRFLYKNDIIRSVQFKSGPILVNWKDVIKNWLNR